MCGKRTAKGPRLARVFVNLKIKIILITIKITTNTAIPGLRHSQSDRCTRESYKRLHKWFRPILE